MLGSPYGPEKVEEPRLGKKNKRNSEPQQWRVGGSCFVGDPIPHLHKLRKVAEEKQEGRREGVRGLAPVYPPHCIRF